MANEKTVKLLQPAYYDKFSCIGSACELDCCKDWNIYIDKNTYLRYKQLKDPDFAATLPQRVKRVRGETANQLQYAQFILGPDGACPFQQEDGLCEIHAKFGHSYLCDTCQIYPRSFSTVFEGVREVSLIMSCPEAVRVALFNPEPMTFEMADKTLEGGNILLRTHYRRPVEDYKGGAAARHAWTVREGCIDILQCRNMPLANRILAMGMLLQKVTVQSESEQADSIPATVATYIKAAQAGEFVNAFADTVDHAEMRTAMNNILVQNMMIHTVSKSRTNRPYRDFLTRYLAEAGENANVILNQPEGCAKVYEFARDRVIALWDGFLEEKGHVLENYFVNYVFSSAFPFSFQQELDPYHHCIILAEQYAIIRMLLCALAAEEGITDEQIISVLTSMSIIVSHNDEARRIIKTYEEAECDSLAHVSFLLRD